MFIFYSISRRCINSSGGIFIKYKRKKNMCEEVVENEYILPEYWVSESVDFNESHHHVAGYDENDVYVN
jgi:hypothetical protein